MTMTGCRSSRTQAQADAMDMKDEWVRAFVAWARSNDNISELWLFGSRADGTSHPGSDIDIGLGLMATERDAQLGLGQLVGVKEPMAARSRQHAGLPRQLGEHHA
jgi:predicted nucleotidyltransferase